MQNRHAHHLGAVVACALAHGFDHAIVSRLPGQLRVAMVHERPDLAGEGRVVALVDEVLEGPLADAYVATACAEIRRLSRRSGRPYMDALERLDRCGEELRDAASLLLEHGASLLALGRSVDEIPDLGAELGPELADLPFLLAALARGGARTREGARTLLRCGFGLSSLLELLRAEHACRAAQTRAQFEAATVSLNGRVIYRLGP